MAGLVRTRWWPWVSLVIAGAMALVGGGCGGEAATMDAAVSDGGAPDSLAADLAGGGDLSLPCGESASCDGVCVDLRNDSRNCGRCGNDCGSKGSCSDGACGACLPAPLLGPPVALPVSARLPASLVAADTSGGHRLDLAYVGRTSRDCFVLGNGGARRFTERRIRVDAILGPEALAAGDLDGDGEADLVLALGDGDALVTALASGAGPWSNAVGKRPRALAIADLDGDGALDVATGNGDDGTVTVLRNLAKGDGRLDVDHAYKVCASPGVLAAGDWSGDGQPDLAVACPADGRLYVLQSLGGGQLGNASVFQEDPGLAGLGGGDLNGDSKLDLVTVRGAGGRVLVYLGDGQGQLAPFDSFLSTDSAAAMALADVDGSGTLDVVVADSSTGGVVFLKNRGDGRLAAPVSFVTGGAASSLVVADLDGDAHLDVAVSLATKNQVAVLWNQLGACR